jgi:hypothetical protein
MLVKEADDKQPAIAELQKLLERPNLSASQRKEIIKEINIMRSGIKGEKEAAYELDFRYKNSKNYILLHDLRFEVSGRVAQIDHLLIDRCLNVYIFETKNFSSGIKINENGEFLSWNSYQKTYEGIPSPLAQNERHLLVLNDFFKTHETPTRLGFKLTPNIIPLVLISNTARIDRPEKFDTSAVLKCDALAETLDKHTKDIGAIELFSNVGRIVSRETIEKVGRLLKYSHKPITINYLGKFGLSERLDKQPKKQNTQPIEKVKSAQSVKCDSSCSKCNSENTTILSGRYGYYFKCRDCQGNTAIKLKCATKGCELRIRKQKDQFFEECATCKSSRLFYKNPEMAK